MSRIPAILTALWAGSLLTVCGIVAPTLFATLDDRRLAGQLAARFFQIEAWLGLGIGLVLLVGLVTREAPAARGRVRGLVVLTAGAPLLSELALRPMMDVARAANEMARFGLLHGVSAALFVVACLGALALAWSFTRPAG